MTRIDPLETTMRWLGIVAIFGANLFAVELPALPTTEFADTEVSTNFTFEVGGGSNRRLVFSLELQASPSNNVEVAIGCDADENVTVSFVESGFGLTIR